MKRQHELPVSPTVSEAYREVRRMGDGARGVVYEVRELRHRRRCALKVLKGESAQSPEGLARFQLQAEIASRLVHPHLVRVLDFGTGTEGQPFLVTELLEGEDLGCRLQRDRRLTPPTVTHIIKQVADALSALHRNGLLHLALKPSNVFLAARTHPGEPDHVKVLDFGTAQVEDARTLASTSSPDDALAYVSPEQASGGHSPVAVEELGPDDVVQPIDARTDQWALACLAWKMLTGRTPFDGEDATALLYEISYEEPRIDPVAEATLPPGLIDILMRALEKRREDRFASIGDFVQAFEAVAGTLPAFEPPHAPAPPPAWATVPRLEPEAVFLPGLSRRESEGPGPSAGGRHRRRRGLRVGVRSPASAGQDAGAPPSTSAATPARAPVAPLAALAEPASPVRTRRWLLAGGFAAAAGVGLAMLIAGKRRRPVSVERASLSGGAASPPMESPPPGPTIEPLASAPPPPPAIKDRRARRTARKRATRVAKSRAAKRGRR